MGRPGHTLLLLLTATVVLTACARPIAPPPTAVPRSATSAPVALPTDTAVPAPSPTIVPTDTPAPTIAPSPSPEPAPARSAALVWQKVVDGLEKPTDLTHAGDGSGLLFVLEQAGRVRVIRDGMLLDTPFLDIESKVGSNGNEQGLLGIAFAPDFVQTRRVFINYTDTDGETIVAGLIASADALTADPNSEWQVIRIEQPYSNHNGGQIHFGPDDMLYIGMGDGGSAGDPLNAGQDVKTLLGKMVRLDVSNSSADKPYEIPADNPDFGADALPEIWSVGLRNPWRFSFDRETGDMYIADVGQGEVEEINLQLAGRSGDNYGWKLREGFRNYAGDRRSDFVEPIHDYAHGVNGCSVTGGYVYRGAALPWMQGMYVYGDYCSGKVWSLERDGDGWKNTERFSTDFAITSFGQDAAGELYLLDREGGVYRLAAE
jgi:glucose/arabinose dehydrogenase